MTGNWRSAARTDVGKVRERNEDAYLDCPEQGLWAVADGVGGHHRGDFASRLIVSSLAQLSETGDFDQRLGELHRCLHWVNRRLTRELTVRADRQPCIVASTVAVLLIEGVRAACVWSGDSRCYLWRQRCLYQLSRDHSRLQQLMEGRQLTAEQAGQYPDATALTSAVGVRHELELASVELSVRPGDVFVLCTDGLYQTLSHETMGQALSLPCPQSSVSSLFNEALQGAADDNLTALVVRQ
jgi:serine/threonine protein phosphatase PrpC